MSDALFLGPVGDADRGSAVTLTGDEARHAVAVRRIAVGESIIVADGEGAAVRGIVRQTAKTELTVDVVERLSAPTKPVRITAAQALAKGDRADLAVSAMTEMGVHRILAWQAARSIVRWHGERAAKGLTKWQNTAREATKQARRYRIPAVDAATTQDVVAAIEGADLALVLHEEAERHIATFPVPGEGDVVVVVGPEGGIAPEELERFVAAGAHPCLISDGVLRTSTAGVVAMGQLEALSTR